MVTSLEARGATTLKIKNQALYIVILYAEAETAGARSFGDAFDEGLVFKKNSLKKTTGFWGLSVEKIDVSRLGIGQLMESGQALTPLPVIKTIG